MCHLSDVTSHESLFLFKLEKLFFFGGAGFLDLFYKILELFFLIFCELLDIFLDFLRFFCLFFLIPDFQIFFNK